MSYNKKEKNIIHIGEISEASATCIERAYKTHPERKGETNETGKPKTTNPQSDKVKQQQNNRTVKEENRTDASEKRIQPSLMNVIHVTTTSETKAIPPLGRTTATEIASVCCTWIAAHNEDPQALASPAQWLQHRGAGW